MVTDIVGSAGSFSAITSVLYLAHMSQQMSNIG